MICQVLCVQATRWQGKPPSLQAFFPQAAAGRGTTERAIHELEDGGLRAIFENALIAAALRSRELATQLGEDHA